jgi:hypothetical protein
LEIYFKKTFKFEVIYFYIFKVILPYLVITSYLLLHIALRAIQEAKARKKENCPLFRAEGIL